MTITNDMLETGDYRLCQAKSGALILQRKYLKVTWPKEVDPDKALFADDYIEHWINQATVFEE